MVMIVVDVVVVVILFPLKDEEIHASDNLMDDEVFDVVMKG